MNQAYYNEIDPFAAEWLQNLIQAGLIMAGDIDQRDIRDVRPSDLRGYTRCHFFAGIGGWDLALQLAGWPEDRPVWTGSCPCQPFSAAGKGGGFDDERHLWPAWFWLIEQRRPAVVFGEQVAAKAVEPWIDLVSSDLEALGYRVGAIAFPAASVGAPHIRDRLSFVADASGQRQQQHPQCDGQPLGGIEASRGNDVGGCGGPSHMATAAEPGRHEQSLGNDRADRRAAAEPGRLRDAGELGDAERDGLRERGRPAADEPHQPGHWSLCDWLPCRDGKARPVEPGTFPLAARTSNRVGRLRAYGNAIVPQAQAEFIRAYLG